MNKTYTDKEIIEVLRQEKHRAQKRLNRHIHDGCLWSLEAGEEQDYIDALERRIEVLKKRLNTPYVEVSKK